MAAGPPLEGVRVVELAGLAPGPFAGLLLADYGATVLRIDRAGPSTPPAKDALTRHKRSIVLDLKTQASKAVLLSLLAHADVLIDPFRPGVLEKLGLCPVTVLLKQNPRLIVARITGFRRDDKYKDMAGHDINYIAVSGVLSMLGRQGERPYAPGNIIGDFASGGAVCFMGILLALLARQSTSKGQVVDANMVDGSAYMATMPRLARKTPLWDGPRGTNFLDGGCPYYDTYETKDSGNYFSVGALEPQFFAALLDGLGLRNEDVLPIGSNWEVSRQDKANWPHMRSVFEKRFRTKTREEWAEIFEGTDACATPVLSMNELEQTGRSQRPVVGLSVNPGLAIVDDEGGLQPGDGGEQTLSSWLGWEKGKQYEVYNGTFQTVRSKL